MNSSSASGSILLRFAITVFIISALAASSVTYLHRQAMTVTDPSTVTPAANDPLLPDITIHPNLAAHSDTINKNLTTPIRQYYATRPERLAAITVAPADHDTYPAQVTITLENADTPALTFGYGTRTDETLDFPTWKPAFLDQEI